LLSPEDKDTKPSQLVVTHKAKYFRDEDGGLSLGPGPFVGALEDASGVKAEIGTLWDGLGARGMHLVPKFIILTRSCSSCSWETNGVVL